MRLQSRVRRVERAATERRARAAEDGGGLMIQALQRDAVAYGLVVELRRLASKGPGWRWQPEAVQVAQRLQERLAAIRALGSVLAEAMSEPSPPPRAEWERLAAEMTRQLRRLIDTEPGTERMCRRALYLLENDLLTSDCPEAVSLVESLNDRLAGACERFGDTGDPAFLILADHPVIAGSAG